MNAQTFYQLVVDARNRQDELLTTKGADYTRKNSDRLSNFKRAAEGLGLTPTQVWAVYAHKHWDAIMTYVSTGKTESEAITGRLDDLHNYLYLLEALIEEHRSERDGRPLPL